MGSPKGNNTGHRAGSTLGGEGMILRLIRSCKHRTIIIRAFSPSKYSTHVGWRGEGRTCGTK